MSEPAGATIVEVFPMRLGSRLIVDVAIEPDSDDFPAIKAEDKVRVYVVAGGHEEAIDLPVWAAPAIPQVKGSRRRNLQFDRTTPGADRLSPGQRLTPSPPA